MNSRHRLYLKWILCFAVIAASLYGVVRLYYRVTDGFTIGNITSDFAYDPRWQVSPLPAEQREELDSALAQPFRYMGKGCQSYVFLSQDGNYILKLFKYQRYRPQPWLKLFSFIPAMEEYRQIKVAKKQRKLEGFFASWVIAFEQLPKETQLLYVHLNKSQDLKKKLTIYDKMGFEHILDLDQTEFLVQRKAKMLCPYISELMQEGHVAEAKVLLSRIIDMILSEYKRGIADNDHALMQNTGVYQGYPIHIDVGQFVISDEARDPQVYKQELFSKTFLLRKWLNEKYPELLKDFEDQLSAVIGPNFPNMKPYFKPHD